MDIDDDLLERARRIAGTPTIKATVEVGLQRIVGVDLMHRHLEWLRRGGLDPDAAREARTPGMEPRG